MAEKKADKKKAPSVLTPEELYEKAELFADADAKIIEKPFRVENYKTAAKIFQQAGDYKDAKERAEECLRLAEEARSSYLEDFYKEASDILSTASTPEDYEAARRIFAKIPGYKDADSLLQKCIDQQDSIALKKVKRNRGLFGLAAVVIAAVIILVNSPLWTSITGQVKPEDLSALSKGTDVPLEEARAGDQTNFGAYEWKVLERDGDELLMVLWHAEKHPETRNGAYHDTLEDVTWADSSLRAWLNGDFLTNGFSEEERARILTDTWENPGNELYGTDGGPDTEDKVTLLTPEMYEKYHDVVVTIAMNFWLRSPGYSQQTAQFVSHRKQIMDYGYAVNSDQFYIVPVIRINAAPSI